MKRETSKAYLLILMCSLLTACTSQTLKPTAYIKYIQNGSNGLKKTEDIDGWQYVIQYKPHDYIIYQEEKGKNDEVYKQKRMKELQGTIWFTISFRRADADVSPLRYNVASLDEYDQRLNYFLNDASKNISLVYGSDTLKAESYIFETNYNLTPQATMVVGFFIPDKTDVQNDFTLSYDDEMFKNGIIKAKFLAKNINKTPQLIY